MTPKIGLVFQHADWLDENNQPILMRVSMVRRGTVYYRSFDGSFPSCCAIESFNRYAKPVSTTND